MTRYPADATPITVQEGAPFTATVTVPLPGASGSYTGLFRIAYQGELILSTTPTVTTGTDEVTVTLALTASQTAALEQPGYDHNLRILQSDVVVAQAFQGSLIVKQDIVSG